MGDPADSNANQMTQTAKDRTHLSQTNQVATPTQSTPVQTQPIPVQPTQEQPSSVQPAQTPTQPSSIPVTPAQPTRSVVPEQVPAQPIPAVTTQPAPIPAVATQPAPTQVQPTSVKLTTVQQNPVQSTLVQPTSPPDTNPTAPPAQTPATQSPSAQLTPTPPQPAQKTPTAAGATTTEPYVAPADPVKMIVSDPNALPPPPVPKPTDPQSDTTSLDAPGETSQENEKSSLPTTKKRGSTKSVLKSISKLFTFVIVPACSCILLVMAFNDREKATELAQSTLIALGADSEMLETAGFPTAATDEKEAGAFLIDTFLEEFTSKNYKVTASGQISYTYERHIENLDITIEDSAVVNMDEQNPMCFEQGIIRASENSQYRYFFNHKEKIYIILETAQQYIIADPDEDDGITNPNDHHILALIVIALNLDRSCFDN
ncbi:MAG: hypothetical protein U9Q67_00205, partial [Patescibacteria group bacterium]|nr:hypothetical protein [Patescibacteria group bacterium]